MFELKWGMKKNWEKAKQKLLGMEIRRSRDTLFDDHVWNGNKTIMSYTF